ncbi:aminodeoxychorismate/anthranilate synthase component II [Maridesulfovibrio hydrothermalis]|uniref:Anthranilate synthase component II n=1 Tax=Maridesulfovibrio hydrothermalis AM13 = DSM 14728 TaxID=1121451 RepID=L0RCM6_9BACT|nr:aminodeoxychorismate/anthranilate synthase component II [Maridesulfovibrio hydrothermalis]CCO23962.1 Anthranilate synthase component II [Maridesulfovibrio hydrothermalis AM13 = DSM 14728]
MKILLIDNNDSFTNNLVHLLAKEIVGAEVAVLPYSNTTDPDMVQPFVTEYDLLIISPGPGCPADYPGYEKIIESDKPVLGVCLGMQILNEYFGGKTKRLEGCFHGRTERINFNGDNIRVARYHSLYCAEVGEALEVIAANKSGVPMAVGHKELPLLGYQFHPESFLTEQAGVFIEYALHYFKLR